MTVQNTEIAELLEKVGDLLELGDANPFRVRAYRNAASTVRGSTRAMAERLADGEDLSKLSGIGKDLAGKIEEIVETGRLAMLDELGEETPVELTELLDVPGLGPKRVQTLYEQLDVHDRDGLLQAAHDGRVAKLPGFGAKLEQTLLRTLEEAEDTTGRTLWIHAEQVAKALVAHLEALDGVKQVTVAGSFRRHAETVGDLDVLVTAKRGTDVGRHFVEQEDVQRVVSQGSTRCTVILRTGLQVDLRVVPEVSYGSALHGFTGNKAHNIAVRGLGQRQGLKINEYGVFRDGERVAGRTEEEVYDAVGLPYIEPELREHRGEIEAAREGELPELVTLDDLRGDLHAHTTATDGRSSLEAMAKAAADLGHEYLAITDHTEATRVAGGLSADALHEHLDAIDALNEQDPGVRLLRSAEVDILEDGSLDLPDDLLERLEITICSVHGAFDLSREEQTARVLKAMDHPRFHVLAHPSGRLLGERDAYAIDLERIVAGAAERGCLLEVNSQPQRLDLTDVWCQAAQEAGVLLVISTDAHAADQLGTLRLGVARARRGWIGKDDVLNTRPWDEVEQVLAKRR